MTAIRPNGYSGRPPTREHHQYSAPHLRLLGRQRGVTPSSLLGDKCLEPRSGDRYIAWGVSPRIPAPKIIISRGAATDVRTGGLRLPPQPKNLSPLRGFLSICRT
jgi:hypothetical protein